MSIIEEGKKIINSEAETLRSLADLLDNEFEKAVNAINSCHGKIVISGIGKAGIIGKKIAASFSSLGSSSFFMHPAEAAHGDFGMVTKNDIIILISNSGSSKEVTDLIPSIKALGSTLIAITGRIDSTLAKEADILLNLGKIEEACYLGLAPTSSTTAILAMGDALAVVSMDQKNNFDKTKYAFFHPGGALGKQLLKVEDIMRKDENNVIVSESSSVKNVLFAITKAQAGCAVIIDNHKKFCGIFTDGDLRKNLEKTTEILDNDVSTVMTKTPKNISEGAYALEALKIMKDNMIGDLPVLNKNSEPIGIINMKDLISIGLI